jgi:hypothetical protein
MKQNKTRSTFECVIYKINAHFPVLGSKNPIIFCNISMQWYWNVPPAADGLLVFSLQIVFV